jgi:cytochrome P450
MLGEQRMALSLQNIYRPEVQADLYTFYHQLRSEAPVHWDAYLNGWVLTRYDDVVACLGDPRISADRTIPLMNRMPETQHAAMRRLFEINAKQMAFLDPPEHTLVRRTFNKTFSQQAVAALGDHIQQIVDRLLDQVQHAGHMDIIHNLAYPLPAIVISELLGVSFKDLDKLRKWYNASFNLLGASITQEQLTQATQTLDQMMHYFRDLVAQHRRQPGHNLMSTLSAGEPGDVLSEEALFANCQLLLDAGHEPLTNLIGNGMLALLRHPDQLQRIQNNPESLSTAIEELLRYDCSVQLVIRLVKEDMQIGDKQIKQGEQIYLVLGAANHDPARFPDPDRLDIDRQNNQHVAFGYARHRCIGKWLGMLEGKIAIATLLRRKPRLRLMTDRPKWQKSLTMRGLESLPVVF